MPSIKICRAAADDLPRILEIYECARRFMRKNGNPNQWNIHYPPQEVVEEDIEAGNLYAAENETGLHGVFALIAGTDPTYLEIREGAWLSDTPYAAIHRVASDGSVHGFFSSAAAFCGEKHGHLRIDTHADNFIMQHVVTKNGFIRCGIILTGDGTPRIAYEKLPPQA